MFSKTFSQLIFILSLFTIFVAVSSKPAWMPRRSLKGVTANFSGTNTSPSAIRPLKQFNPRAPKQKRQNGGASSRFTATTTAAAEAATTTDPNQNARIASSPSSDAAPTQNEPIMDFVMTMGPTTTEISMGMNMPTAIPMRRGILDSLPVPPAVKNQMSAVEPFSFEEVVSETN